MVTVCTPVVATKKPTNAPPKNGRSRIPETLLCFSRIKAGRMLECADLGSRGFFNPYPQIHAAQRQPMRTNDTRVKPRHSKRVTEYNGLEKKRRPRKMSKCGLRQHDVFLGGSCNPTTWRRDVAIPLFDSHSITYFNPQVKEWRPELMDLEHKAKESSNVLLYVLDKSTRNVVSTIESALFAGSKRNLVLVVDKIKPNELVAGEPVSSRECEELNGSLLLLRKLARRQGVPVFESIQSALDHTAELVLKHLRPKGRLMFATRPNSLNEKCLNLICPHDNEALFSLQGKYTSTRDVWSNNSVVVTSRLKHDPSSQSSELAPRSDLKFPFTQQTCDIFIGASASDLPFVEECLTPLLIKSGLKYKFGIEAHSSELLESPNMCSVLLFVMTNKSRSLDTLALASYFMGLGKTMVLCVQDLIENSVVCGEKLSNSASKDYNRGRAYLRDEASRRGVSYFDDITQSAESAIAKCLSGRLSL